MEWACSPHRKYFDNDEVRKVGSVPELGTLGGAGTPEPQLSRSGTDQTSADEDEQEGEMEAFDNDDDGNVLDSNTVGNELQTSESSPIRFTDWAKLQNGTLEGYFCFLEIHNTKNLWLASKLRADPAEFQSIMRDTTKGRKRAFDRQIRIFAALMRDACSKCSCDWDTWRRKLEYP